MVDVSVGVFFYTRVSSRVGGRKASEGVGDLGQLGETPSGLVETFGNLVIVGWVFLLAEDKTLCARDLCIHTSGRFPTKRYYLDNPSG